MNRHSLLDNLSFFFFKIQFTHCHCYAIFLKSEIGKESFLISKNMPVPWIKNEIFNLELSQRIKFAKEIFDIEIFFVTVFHCPLILDKASKHGAIFFFF